MSYKLDLSHLQRDGEVSITQQLVDRISAAIESGEVEPGAKLPPTRELAAEAGVNHLTAARVYRKLAELGYVAASVGRGTFVRALTPASSASHGDDWQAYSLPHDETTYSEQILADTFSLAGRDDVISLAIGWPAPSTYPTEEVARITADVFAEEGGNALSYLPAEGLFDLREQIASRGRTYGYAQDADEVVITSGAQQAIALCARATLEPGDVAAIERLLARHEVKLVGLQTACQNPTGRNLSEERRARLAQLAVERNFFILEDRVYADMNFEGRFVRSLRELAPAHVLYVNSLSKVVGGGLRAGWVAARGPVRERIATL